MGIKGVPFGYLKFSRAIGRIPCPHARAGAGAGAGPGSGSGPGLGSGSGSLPGLVLFELGLTGMGYAKHTRPAIRIRTAPPTDPPRYPDPNRSANGCKGKYSPEICLCHAASIIL